MEVLYSRRVRGSRNMSDTIREIPKSIRFEELGPEINELLSTWDIESKNRSLFIRHLIRLGIKAERERRRVLANAGQIDTQALSDMRGNNHA